MTSEHGSHRILVLGWKDEPVTAYVASTLGEAGLQYDELYLDDITDGGQLSISSQSDNLTIETRGAIVELAQYRAFFQRLWWKPHEDERISAAVTRLVHELVGWLEYCEGTVVNRPSAGISNGNKLAHLALLRKYLFDVPTSFVSTDPNYVYARTSPDGSWIYKGVSGERTIARLLDEETYFRVGSELSAGPVLFQRRVRGRDVRVHVVGTEVFGVAVKTKAIDYRYPGDASVSFESIEVPPSIRVRCLEYCQKEGLLLCGFDFKLTPKGMWFALEANPMPAFRMFDQYISGAMARSLTKLLATRSRDVQEIPDEPVGLIRDEDRPKVWR